MNQRIENMRKSVDALNDAGVRGTRFYALVCESLCKTEGEPVQIRRAKAIANLLEQGPVAILPYELIVGSMSGYCPVEKNVPSYEEQTRRATGILETYLANKRGRIAQAGVDRDAIKTFEKEFTSKKSRWTLMSRVHHDANITYEDLQKLIADMQAHFAAEPDLEKYEIGRELERSLKLDYGPGVKEQVDALPWFAANHLSLDYGMVLARGWDDIRAQIARELQLAQDAAKREYYTAARIAADAAVTFIRRHAQAAKSAAAVENDVVRRRELERIAQICAKIATQPAGSFYEGVQLVWLLHLAQSYAWGSALSFGRFDQYMLGLYERDLAAGVMTRGQAMELLCCLWLKVNEPKMRTVQSMTIGGITPDGRDAANALTALCLDVIREMQLPYPNVGVRINERSPQWLDEGVTEAVKRGGGQPMIMNDGVFIPALRKLGYADAYANDYYNMGCVEIMIPGKQPNWGVTDPIAFPMLIEQVFEKYRAGAYKLFSFEEFYQAYREELGEAVGRDYREALAKIQDIKGKCYDPLASLLTDGCLENGRDMFQDGSELGTHWSFYAYGLGTAADSMAAVKKAVYEEKLLTIEQLSGILERNYEGNEPIRALLSNKMPHYGNDDDEVDLLARDMLACFTRGVMALNRPGSPDKFVATLFGYFFHIYHGEITGATPNGRKRGEAFSDSMGPSQGKDIEGPTRMLNSVVKLDHTDITGGYALNIKLSPGLASGRAGTEAVTALIRTYLQQGGPQIQFNMVDVESLRLAKREPEKYRNLIVRIGGYCEYFVNLDGSLQDEIIERTVHQI